MKKRIWLWINGLLLLALLTGCTLAQPEYTGTAGGDTFCGFWLIYDRWENEDSHVFNISSETEQMLLEYVLPRDGSEELVYTSKTGSSVGGVATNLNFKDEGVDIDIKGTIYLLKDEDQSIMEQGYREVWLQGDVVQSFRDFYVQPPEGMSREVALKPGETVIVYIPQEQIDRHGPELTQMAEKEGAHLIIKSESPRQLKVVSVYQRPDGTIYADEGGTRFVLNSASTSYSQTVENTQTVGGKTTKKKVTATIAVQWIDELEAVRLVEMNAQNTVVRTTGITLSDVQSWAKQQKPFFAGEDCEYVIVEETYETVQEESYVKRTVYNPPKRDEYTNLLHTFHFSLENGLTEAASMNIEFSEANLLLQSPSATAPSRGSLLESLPLEGGGTAKP